jgi:hypothetical protein
MLERYETSIKREQARQARQDRIYLSKGFAKRGKEAEAKNSKTETGTNARGGREMPKEWDETTSELLDDLAGLCKHWSRNRSKGITPSIIKSAIFSACKRITVVEFARKIKEAIKEETKMKKYTPDQLVGTRWCRGGFDASKGVYNGYEVIFVTNTAHEHANHPAQVVYNGDNGKIWSLPLNKWPGRLMPEPKETIKMKKYTTKPIDYAGCHPVIAEHLKRGEAILCRTLRENEVFITAYEQGEEFPYRSSYADNSWRGIEPGPQKKTETRVKKASEIVKWLEDNGYILDGAGNWQDRTGTWFRPEMFFYCGKPVHTNPWEWLPEWLEEVEIEEE